MTMIKKLCISIILYLLMLGVSGCDILLEETGKSSGGLEASGVVEAIEIVLAPEIGGRVSKVYASEGDRVKAGDPLFEIEDVLLLSQLKQAEAVYSVSQANYALIAAGLTKEQNSAAISAAELTLAAAKYDYEKLFDNTDLLAAQALQTRELLEQELENLNNPILRQAELLKTIADAKKEIETAERRLSSVSSSADESDISAAEAQVILAKDALDDAKEDFKPYQNKPEDNLQRANYQSKLSAAQQVYDAAVRKLNALKGTGSEADIAVAEADLAAAQAKLIESEREWERIKDGPKKSEVALLEAQISKAIKDYDIYKNGPDPDDVILAEARVSNASAQLNLAKSESPTQEELDIAQAEVNTAKVNLEAIQVQIGLLVIKSPVDGVVLTRNIEIGEVIQPGLTAITVGQLDKLTITVYIPEDKYGQINLGDSAILRADSFPDMTFQATVIRIADQAEYTPRNVQTQEDRKTTVFAVELSVNDPDGKLKPGMPTDVEFSN